MSSTLGPDIAETHDIVHAKIRSCDACRRLKVQCTFESKGSDVCKRCMKACRQCIISQRKRRTVASKHSVAELEQQVAALSSSIEAIRSSTNVQNSQLWPRTSQECSAALLGPGASSASSRPAISLGYLNSFNGSVGMGSVRALREDAQARIYTDVVEGGIVGREAATSAYTHFAANVLAHFPIISISPEMTADIMRETKPILFLAVLNAASGILPFGIQLQLNRELMRRLADKVFVVGEKSLELIQALQLATIWYYPPRRYENLTYYQLIHGAAVMALELGLNRKGKGKRSFGLNGPKIPIAQPFCDSGAIESRRAWLGCYFLAAGTAQNLRRENLIRWSPYMDDCLKVLESSRDPANATFCHWVRLQHLADDMSIHWSIDNPEACTSLDDASVRFTIKGFESRFRALTSDQAKISKCPDLRLGESATRLFMHELALHAGQDNDDMQPPFDEDALKSIRPTQAAQLSAWHMSSLSICLANIHTILDTFISLPIETIRELPSFHFVRLIYAAIVLVKMAFDTTVPDSEIGEMFSLDDFKIEMFLDTLATLMETAAMGDCCPSASKFAIVFAMLKSLYQRSITYSSMSLSEPPQNHALQGKSHGGSLPFSPPDYQGSQDSPAQVSWHEYPEISMTSTADSLYGATWPDAFPDANGFQHDIFDAHDTALQYDVTEEALLAQLMKDTITNEQHDDPYQRYCS